MNRWMQRITMAMVGIAAMGSVALGQAEPAKPPPISDMGGPVVIVYYLIGFVGLAICVALAAFPGRRSFED